jgi:hypothetical protein
VHPDSEDPAMWEASFEDQKIEYWISLGLKFFQQLCRSHSIKARARTFFENPWRRGHFLSKAIKGECKWPRGICAAHPLNFDHNSPENEGSKNGAWCSISDVDFDRHKTGFIRRWGYVIWDRERLDAWKILEKNQLNSGA